MCKLIDETVVDEINTIIEEKIEESDELKNVSVDMIKASLGSLGKHRKRKYRSAFWLSMAESWLMAKNYQ